MDNNVRTASISRKRPRRARYKKRVVIINPYVLPERARKKTSYRYNTNKKPDNRLNREQLMDKYIPRNLHYLLYTKSSPFNIFVIKKDHSIRSDNGVIYIPEKFTLCDEGKALESISALRQILSALFLEDNSDVIFDYMNCCYIGIETQALMDVILYETRVFFNKCEKIRANSEARRFPRTFGGKNINHKDIQKMMFSVGSPANLGIREADFEDVIKLPMKSHFLDSKRDPKRMIEQKDLDTTEIVDYVISCTSAMNKNLTKDVIKELSTVVGEILINAEEHSTFHHRFSMAYFQDRTVDNKHFGTLRFVILDFGQTIYDTFKENTKCPAGIIDKMKALSERYTKLNLFSLNRFEEETLWTLYALQQGVSSVSGKKRGSGTIAFINSFFKIKGSPEDDNSSKMVILSGNTRILFDGKYRIVESVDENGGKILSMTFNKSARIEDAPDPDYVQKSSVFFPGTMITANILLNDDI